MKNMSRLVLMAIVFSALSAAGSTAVVVAQSKYCEAKDHANEVRNLSTRMRQRVREITAQASVRWRAARGR
jgi:hypothetical protein